MAPSPEGAWTGEGHARGVVSKAQAVWGVRSEAEGWPTGDDGSAEWEVKAVRGGPWVG